MGLDWTIVVSSAIGGVIAAGTGFFFERRREAAKSVDAQRFLNSAIANDLRHSLGLFDKVEEEWEKTQTVWFNTLYEFRESRAAYNNSRDSIHLYEDSELRQAVFRYYLQSGERISRLEYEQQRKQYLVSQMNKTISDIRLRSPEINQESAQLMARSILSEEANEFHALGKSLPENVAKLIAFKEKARDLLAKLETAIK